MVGNLNNRPQNLEPRIDKVIVPWSLPQIPQNLEFRKNPAIAQQLFEPEGAMENFPYLLKVVRRTA